MWFCMTSPLRLVRKKVHWGKRHSLCPLESPSGIGIPCHAGTSWSNLPVCPCSLGQTLTLPLERGCQRHLSSGLTIFCSYHRYISAPASILQSPLCRSCMVFMVGEGRLLQTRVSGENIPSVPSPTLKMSCKRAQYGTGSTVQREVEERGFNIVLFPLSQCWASAPLGAKGTA